MKFTCCTRVLADRVHREVINLVAGPFQFCCGYRFSVTHLNIFLHYDCEFVKLRLHSQWAIESLESCNSQGSWFSQWCDISFHRERYDVSWSLLCELWKCSSTVRSSKDNTVCCKLWSSISHNRFSRSSTVVVEKQHVPIWSGCWCLWTTLANTHSKQVLNADGVPKGLNRRPWSTARLKTLALSNKSMFPGIPKFGSANEVFIRCFHLQLWS